MPPKQLQRCERTQHESTALSACGRSNRDAPRAHSERIQAACTRANTHRAGEAFLSRATARTRQASVDSGHNRQKGGTMCSDSSAHNSKHPYRRSGNPRRPDTNKPRDAAVTLTIAGARSHRPRDVQPQVKLRPRRPLESDGGNGRQARNGKATPNKTRMLPKRSTPRATGTHSLGSRDRDAPVPSQRSPAKDVPRTRRRRRRLHTSLEGGPRTRPQKPAQKPTQHASPRTGPRPGNRATNAVQKSGPLHPHESITKTLSPNCWGTRFSTWIR